MGRVLSAGSLGVALLLAAVLPVRGDSEKHYVGASACTKCHIAVTQKWTESLHNEILRAVTERGVEGDFAVNKVILGNSTYLLQHRDGNYFITESELTGRPWTHRVDYTLGSRRIQQYLTTLPDGRIILLPPSWDDVRKKWIRDIDLDNPEEDSNLQIQIWNKTCYSCHVTRPKKNFDLEQNTYHTTWQDSGVGCESCHGPGSKHVARATNPRASKAKARTGISTTIINLARLDAARSTMICAQCHSFRDIYAEGFNAGDNYYDYFLPVMEYRLPTSDDPAYWTDGRPRWLSNEAFALWESECYLKGGASCTTCHSDSHVIDVARNPQLRPQNNALCTPCHATIAANVSAHTHHAPQSSGSSCIECHMPAIVIGLDARVRDHSMSVPVPENTIRHGIPNACNLCHKNESAAWTLREVNKWYGDKSGIREAVVRRADAFAQARKGDTAAIPALLQILSDPLGGPLIRANAVGYLGNFSADPSAYKAVLKSFSDHDALVRLTAASAIKPSAAQREAVAPALVTLLRDPVAIVRVSAAIALVSMGVQSVPEEYSEQFERAKELYRRRAALNSDDALQQFAAGRFFFLAGDIKGSVDYFRASLKLDPKIPAQFDLGLALARDGDSQNARKILEAIPSNDPQYTSAQRLLASMELNHTGRDMTSVESKTAQKGSEARAAYLNGQLLYQNGNYGGALSRLEDALSLAPRAVWATEARTYRAICLEKLGRTDEAEAAMQSLAGNAEVQGDVDLQLAHVELLYETGRTGEALKQIDSFISFSPTVPMAYFWRARLLLQLHRTEEAAHAAEKSILLLPNYAPAHNLLLRIYLLQGRTKEAAEQARWLRDYERRRE